jgi:uncharacterized protein YciI
MTDENGQMTAGGPPMRMSELILGLLIKGPTWTHEADDQVVADQRSHLQLLRRLGDEGTLLMAGPIPDGDPIRGIVVCQAGSESEIRQRFADDAHIRSGRLLLELYPWLVPSGILEKPLLPPEAGAKSPAQGGPTRRAND